MIANERVRSQYRALENDGLRLQKKGGSMETRRFIYYQEEEMFVGWLEEYPDYRTQGESMEELEENLRDLLQEMESGTIPCIRRVGELRVA